MKINRQLIKDGYISERKHPTEDYYIYNYTAKAQWEQEWNEDIMNCRGLILDGTGKIIAKTFSKFFNIGEYNQHSHLWKIPNYNYFDMFDKMDGSLGILYQLPCGKFQIATRGSFESEQAQKANNILKEKYEQKLNEMTEDFESFFKNYTLLFEIIYPENRIVIDYKNQVNLVLLACVRKFDNTTNGEYNYEELLLLADKIGCPMTQYYGRVSYNRHAFLKLDERILEGKEGFVLKFDNGLRVKIKSEEYVRLHRLLTGVSNKSIWVLLRNNQDIDELLDRVPDEFYNWVRKTKSELMAQYAIIEQEAMMIVDDLPIDLERKNVASVFKKHKDKMGLLFAMLDNKDYSDTIWRMIRPEYSKPFNDEKSDEKKKS